jgi:hypothetical protein
MSLNKFTDEATGYDLKLNVGADTLKCNTADVLTNLIVSTVNGESYPPSTSRRQAGLLSQTYTELTPGDFDILTLYHDEGAPADTAVIETITAGTFQGQELKLCVLGGAGATLTIKAGGTGTGAKIETNGGLDVVLSTSSPNYFRYVVLKWFEGTIGVNTGIWGCTGEQK